MNKKSTDTQLDYIEHEVTQLDYVENEVMMLYSFFGMEEGETGTVQI